VKIPSPVCEAIQCEISAALDDGIKLPAAVLEHVDHCPDCAAFLDAWTGDVERLLAAHLPPAGPALREKILSMPEESVRAASSRHRFRGYVSATAAAVVIGICGYSLIDINPGGTTRRTTMAEREYAAIKSDFRRGLAALREPAGAIQRALRP